MSNIKQFADTSAVSLAYAIDAASNADSLNADVFHFVPFTSEGFQLAKDSQMSTAISSDRRPSGSKNTKGNATGSASLEFGFTPFALDMLKLSMMGKWEEVMEDDGAGGSQPSGESFLVDGEDMNFFVVEKRIRNTVGGTPMNFLERYFGNLVNEASIEIGSSDLISMSVSTMAAYGDIDRADASSDPNAGGLATTYEAPATYEIADAANNIKSVTLKDAQGNPLEVTFSDLTLSISNNVREQVGVGHEFAAGMAMGKVNVQLSGTVYYYDDTVLRTHLENGYVSAEFSVETEEGTLIFHLPAMKAEAPNANAQGENQDYTQSLTLNGERGTVNLGGEDRTCVIAIVKKTA